MNKPTITSSYVDLASTLLTEKKATKFFESISVLNKALENDHWEPRGEAKVGAGLKDFVKASEFSSHDGESHYNVEDEIENAMFYLLMFGITGSFSRREENLSLIEKNADMIASRMNLKKGRTANAVVSAVKLMIEVVRAVEYLNSIVKQGRLDLTSLSDKQIHTLSNSAVDVDIMSLRLAKIVYPVSIVKKDVHFANAERGRLKANAVVSRYVFAEVPRIEWEQGTRFGATGKDSHQCDACGKNIPSQTFVYLQATCKRTGDTLGLQFGTDCASRILNVKSEGVKGGLHGATETVDGEWSTTRNYYGFEFPESTDDILRELYEAINTEGKDVYDAIDVVEQKVEAIGKKYGQRTMVRIKPRQW